MLSGINPVSADFPVWVASHCGDLQGFAAFVKGGHARRVGLQFFSYRPGFDVTPVDFRTFKDGLMLHALVAVDHAGRRIAAGVGRVPYAWVSTKRAAGDWNNLRRDAAISDHQISLIQEWQR